MFKEFTENAVAKAKEDVVLTNGVLVLIALVSFITGLVIGILCASGAKSKKNKKLSFNADDYVRDLNFDDDEDDDDYEYSF
ncbi:MAG: hypothetical protein J6C96_03610 [Oscillospiraceae bacterium]|nr:hypothetical protein [Oscillospiraceae bacterium]